MAQIYLTKQQKQFAYQTILFIFIAAIPFWILIGLQIIVFRNDIVGFWLKAPNYYPFSFSFAMFVAFACGTTVVWSMQKKQSDINLLVVIAGILFGSLLNISFAPFSMASRFLGWIISVLLLIALLILKQIKLAFFLCFLSMITLYPLNK